jgi:hypothetical protein
MSEQAGTGLTDDELKRRREWRKFGTESPHEPTDEFVVHAFAEGARSLWPDSRDPGWHVTFQRWLAARDTARAASTPPAEPAATGAVESQFNAMRNAVEFGPGTYSPEGWHAMCSRMVEALAAAVTAEQPTATDHETADPLAAVAALRDLARRCHNGAGDPWQEFYDRGYSPMLDHIADRLAAARSDQEAGA